uniref:Uncharacterized protein LOC105048396 n=1 Tax=Elaeis guineensis var. tenera TaxID=51953 RepID=A0A6I9RNT1_ELAGV|nr:uncharacterized protein LOC105048396 [Elaeis guineensis]
MGYCLLNELDDEVAFSATGATKIYVNLEMEYVATLIERFSSVSNDVQIIQAQPVNDIPLEEQIFEHVVAVRGTIIDVDNFFGWYYVSCNICSKKVIPDDVYICDACNKECKFPLVKYKIHLKVSDKTAVSTFVLFNVVAEKLLDTSAHKLFNRQSRSNTDLPAQIHGLSEMNYVFKLKLNNYYLKEGLENYCVSRIFLPNKTLKMQYKSKKFEQALKETEKFEKSELCRFMETTVEEEPAVNLEDSEEDVLILDNLKGRKKRKKIVHEDGSDDDDKSAGKQKLQSTYL